MPTTRTHRNPIELLPGQLDEDTSSVDTVHENILCDGTACEGVTDCIRGVRYHCSRCANVDFCALCVQGDGDRADSLKWHDRSHPLLRCLLQARFLDLAQLPEDVDREEAIRWMEQTFERVVDLRTEGHKPVAALGEVLLGQDGAGVVEWEGTVPGAGDTGDVGLNARNSSTVIAGTAAHGKEDGDGDGEEENKSQDRRSLEKGKGKAEDQDPSQEEQKETLAALHQLMNGENSSRWSRTNRINHDLGPTPSSSGDRSVVPGFDVRKQDQLQDALKGGFRVIGEKPPPDSGGYMAMFTVEPGTRTTLQWQPTNAAGSSNAQVQGVTHNPDEMIKVLCGQLGIHNYGEDKMFCDLLQSGKPATRVIELLPGEGEQKLQCRLMTVDVLAATAYEAVCHDSTAESNFQPANFDRLDVEADYALRSMANISHPIYTPSGFVSVDFGLRNALRRLRRKDLPRYIWVDRISVNQSDVIEQMIQASYTRSVFNRAKRVLVWAGESDAYTSAAVAMFEKLEIRCSEGTIPGPEELTSDPQFGPLGSFGWVALFEFFKRPVFQRIWSIQEVAFAQAVVVVCGEYELSWSSVEAAAALLASPTWIHHVTSQMRMAGQCLHSPLSIIQLLITTAEPNKNGVSRHDLILTMKLVREQIQARRCIPLHEILRVTLSFPVKDPRDKVFGILGLHPGFFGMKPDYTKEVAEVFTDATKRILSNEKTFEVCGSWVSTTEENAERGLPSWVPNYSSISRPLVMHLSLREARYSASGNVPISASWPLVGQTNVLQTPSYHTDTIVAVADEPPTVLQEARILWWIRTVDSALGPRYTTGETTLEAFWRTCVVNASIMWQQQPAPTSYLHAFGMIVLGLQRQIVGDVDDSVTSSFNNPLQFELVQAFQSAGLSEQGRAARILGEVISHLQVTSIRRNLFITSTGYLCLGPATASVGDELHVIPGAKVPFILRKREKAHWEEDHAGLGYHTMIGEAYAHGLMSGEVLMRDGFEWKDILLK